VNQAVGTALHVATRLGNLECMRLLADHGADTTALRAVCLLFCCVLFCSVMCSVLPPAAFRANLLR
jgi:hypothetical protein